MKFLDNLLVAAIAGCLMSMNAVASHNTEEALEDRISAEGKLNVVEPGSEAVNTETASDSAETTSSSTETAAVMPEDGESVYNMVCAVCHNAGVAGAPKTGDIEAWKARIEQGITVLTEHAINGFQGNTGVMIAKGGNAALSDSAVGNAVEYMVAQSSAALPSAGDSADTTNEESPSAESSESMAAIDGAAIYNGICVACHSVGVAGAPKVGDAAAWEARIAQGNEVLYDNAINGFQGQVGVMIPKGGNTALSDDEVKAAVDHMVEQSQ